MTPSGKEKEFDRARGALLGLAVGDAIGTTVEFKQRGTFTPMTGMVGGGPFKLLSGQWTDDTSMALCLAPAWLKMGLTRMIKCSATHFGTTKATCPATEAALTSATQLRRLWNVSGAAATP